MAGNAANLNGSVWAGAAQFSVPALTQIVDNNAPGSLATSLSMPENNTLVGTLSAEDGTPANQLVWALTGGADAAKFTLDSHGVLRFKTAPDFETPASSASPASNTYSVQVTVADLGGHTSTGTVSVAVTDVVLEPTLTVVTDGVGNTVNGKQGDSVAATITFAEAITVTGGSLSTSTFLPVLMADGHPLAVTSVSQGSGSLANVFTVTATLPAGNDTQVTLTGLSVNGITLTGISGSTFINQAALTTKTAYTLDNLAPNLDTAGPAISLTLASGHNNTSLIDVNDQVVLTIPLGEQASQFLNLPGNTADGIIYSFSYSGAAGFATAWALNKEQAQRLFLLRQTGSSTPDVDFFTPYESQTQAQKDAITSHLTQSALLTVGGAAVTGNWTTSGSNLVFTHTVTQGEHGVVNYNPTVLQKMLMGTRLSDGGTANTTAELPQLTDLAGNGVRLGGNDWGAPGATFAAIASPAGVDTAPPVISGVSTYSVVHLNTAVGTLGATDDYSTANHLAWALVSGIGDADNSRFSLDPSTGVLRFVAAPDLWNPIDVGADNTYQVRVSVTDEAGHTGYQALSVKVVNPVSISGLVTSGGVLTADTSAITNADANGISYQWQVNNGSHDSPSWAAISGATSSTYNIVAGDGTVGKEVRVHVSYTDTSNATRTVDSAPLNSPVSGAAWLSGHVTSGGLLSVDTTALADPNGLGTFHVQWQRQDYLQTYSWNIPWTNNGLSPNRSGTLSSSLTYTDQGLTGDSLLAAEDALFNAITESVDSTDITALRSNGVATNRLDLTTINGFHITQPDDTHLFIYQAGTVAPIYNIEYFDHVFGGGIDSYIADFGGDKAKLRSIFKSIITATNVPGTAHWTDVAADSSTYTLTDADLGHLLRANITYTDGAGYTESVTTVVNHAPTVSSAGAITIPSFTKAAGGEISYTLLKSNTGAADADTGDTLSFLISKLDTGTLQKWNGSAWVSATAGTTTLADGEKLKWVPTNGASAPAGDTNAFDVQVYDGHLYSQPVTVHTVLPA